MRGEQPEEFRPEFGHRKRKDRKRKKLARANHRLRRENLELRAQLAIMKMVAVLAIRRVRTDKQKGKRGNNDGHKCGG